jgi:hypothetical protein
MKARKFEDWQSRRREFLAERALLDTTRGRKGRPRDPEKRELLLRLDIARREAWLRSGRLIRIAPRRYRIDTSCAP